MSTNTKCPHCEVYRNSLARYAKRHELLLAALRIGAVERALIIAETAPSNFITDVEFQNPTKSFIPCDGQLDFLKELDESLKHV